MSKPQNPNAFPTDIRLNPDDPGGNGGMRLRDWFAGQALAGLSVGIGQVEPGTRIDRDGAAYDAYRLADAMLAARGEP